MSDRDPAHALRSCGLQVTAQRVAVLNAVADRPHSSAAQIAEVVRSEISAVSRQAVYDALGVLTEKGIIRRIQPSGSPARYEDRVDDNHHHLVCRVCGSTVDVECAKGETPCLSVVDPHGYAIDEAEVIYWGTCPACQSESHGAPADENATDPESTKKTQEQQNVQ